jgi:hypothetical protein
VQAPALFESSVKPLINAWQVSKTPEEESHGHEIHFSILKVVIARSSGGRYTSKAVSDKSTKEKI